MKRALALLLLWGCSDPATEPPPETTVEDRIEVLHLGEHVDADGEASIELDAAGVARVEIHLDGAARVLELDVEAEEALLEQDAGQAHADGLWFRPSPHDEDVLLLDLTAGRHLRVWARGAPVPAARRERSLVWTEAALLDDVATVGLDRVLTAAGGDLPGGVLLDRWFRRFATTIHSERAAPAQLMDEIAAVQGADPATWDLDALPFVVTGVHNRIDLGPRGGGCGELRVSIASTHDTYAPLHMLFLFRQSPQEDDIAPDGDVHCLGTARRWARLSDLDGADFYAAARAVLDATLVHDRFLLAESVELTVSPWEWRQWAPEGDGLENPPLFQTVAVPLVNAPGQLRDDFLAYVEDNAAALADRTAEIPATFRAQSARVPPSVPAERLDLTGLDPAVAAAYPSLADDIEIVGCPTCHTADANFVQTLPDRTFSPFYDRELDARAVYLDAMSTDTPPATPPFGPLQD